MTGKRAISEADTDTTDSIWTPTETSSSDDRNSNLLSLLESTNVDCDAMTEKFVINHDDDTSTNPDDERSDLLLKGSKLFDIDLDATTEKHTISEADNNRSSAPHPVSEFSAPVPGSTFILQSVSDGRVLTLISGTVVLAPRGGRGAIHWTCVETRGWLGFKNIVSGKFLGYDNYGGMICAATEMKEWEQFCTRSQPDGGVVLLMTHWDELWGVGVDGQERKGWMMWGRGRRVCDALCAVGVDGVDGGVRDGPGVDRLVKMKEVGKSGVRWQFIEVHSTEDC